MVSWHLSGNALFSLCLDELRTQSQRAKRRALKIEFPSFQSKRFALCAMRFAAPRRKPLPAMRARRSDGGV